MGRSVYRGIGRVVEDKADAKGRNQEKEKEGKKI